MAQKRNTLSDDALAGGFVAQFSNSIRYNAQLGQWFVWNGKLWEIDYRSRADWRCLEFLRATVDELSVSIAKALRAKSRFKTPTEEEKAEASEAAANIAVSLLSASRLKNVMHIAQRHKKITMDINSWDADPWLLNTPNGTVNLKTGELRKHDPLDYMTKTTSTDVNFTEPELWLTFLHRITNGNSEHIAYLQKILGYSLVGLVKENRMWFFYGTGANGKSVLLNTAYHILGSYARWANSSTFMRTFGQQHPTELADLCGARLVMCGETSRNHQWDEERIKSITGGEPIKARFMRQDFFEYTPQFTVVLAGNHKPKLENVDEAVRRRFNLVPFDVTIPEKERDNELSTKLEAEFPQILGWMIQGCLKWQDQGLEAPDVVRNVTRDYLTQTDCMLSWLEECAEFSKEAFTTSSDLYRSFNTWTAENGEKPQSMRGFSMQLEDRARALGIEKIKTAKSRGFKGIGLLVYD